MRAKVKSSKVVATISRPSLSVVVNRGSIGAEIDRGELKATVTDTATAAKIFIPTGYIPTSSGPPTYTPPEFTGFVPLCMDITNAVLYYFINGVWLSLAGGGPAPVTNPTYNDGTNITYNDGSVFRSN